MLVLAGRTWLLAPLPAYMDWLAVVASCKGSAPLAVEVASLLVRVKAASLEPARNGLREHR